MLEKALAGADVVFANNLQKPRQRLAYRVANAGFNSLYEMFSCFTWPTKRLATACLAGALCISFFSTPNPP